MTETAGVINDLVELKETAMFGSEKEKDKARIDYKTKLAAFAEVSKDLLSVQQDVLMSLQQKNLDDFNKRLGR